MAAYKSESIDDEDVFIPTRAYWKLYNTFKELKDEKGRFIQVIGSPGTGKSTNIYHALANLDLDVYEPVLFLDNLNRTSGEVFEDIFSVFKDDLDVTSDREVFQKASNFDVVLLADKLLDSEYLDPDKVGLSKWIEDKGIKSFYLYLLFIYEYLIYKNDLNKVNVILHHSPVIIFKGIKYDLFTDFGWFSRLLRAILGLFFEYVQISYLESEVMKIVKNHPQYENEEQIKDYIKKYGKKPRLICEALENRE